MLTDAQEDYTRGFVPFLGVQIFLDSRPLIPRSETEYWVEKALEIIPRTGALRVLDLFSGSGCIGVAALKHRPNTSATCAELEPRHLPTIKKNIEVNEINPNRVSIVQSDVWSNVAGLFEYIFANPPYVSEKRGTASHDALIHEPHEALFAHDDGFEYIAKTIEGLPRYLVQHGTAWIEHEPFHTQRILECATSHKLHVTTHTDQYGVERYSQLTHIPVA